MAVSNLTMVSAVEASALAAMSARAGTAALAGPAAPAVASATVAAACQEAACSAPGSLRCGYVDSGGRSCTTRWCHRHLRTVGGIGYCRRHASTVEALGGRGGDPRALPPVDHRGASLVNWIWSEGLPGLHAAVASGTRPDEIVFDDRAVSVVRLGDGRRRWERGWRIGDRDGLTGRVLICVDETDDARISVQVDDTVMAVGVPPWVARRRAGREVTPDVDAAERAHFYGFLIDQVRRALALRG